MEYFYCKYGGVIPICSDCRRNIINHKINKDAIKTWLVPRKGTKQCEDYINLCDGCNNVKGCITCDKGEQYAHITEINNIENEKSI